MCRFVRTHKPWKRPYQEKHVETLFRIPFAFYASHFGLDLMHCGMFGSFIFFTNV
jgi:hypothetical protein